MYRCIKCRYNIVNYRNTLCDTCAQETECRECGELISSKNFGYLSANTAYYSFGGYVCKECAFPNEYNL